MILFSIKNKNNKYIRVVELKLLLLDILASGYYGGQSEDTYGYESLSVAGVTNRDLIMKAFGYAAGNAIVTYTYWEGKIRFIMII